MLIQHNPARELACAGGSPPSYCLVQTIPCTDNAEALAVYDCSNCDAEGPTDITVGYVLILDIQ